MARVAAAAAANPLEDDFKEVSLNVVKLTNNQIMLLTNEGVTLATDLINVDEEGLIGVFPKSQANKLIT